MVDHPCEFKGLRGIHARNVLAEERDDLLIGMTLAVEHNHTRIDPGAGVDAGDFCRDRRSEWGICACHGDEF